MTELHVFQILNHYTPRAELDPGFGVLDNSVNERPDWYEYWPIRKFLTTQPLDEGAFYGFLSPKFRLKTNMTAAGVRQFMADVGADVDVVLLSPSIHLSAYFWSVFEHGEFEHPGLMATANKLFARIGRAARLEEMVTDSRNTVHSNYFLAKPRFWREWLAINEQMYAIAENADDPLGRALRAPTHYRGRVNVQMKIFVMERIATFLLVTDARFVARVHDPFAARARIYKLPMAVVCDALKIGYVTQGRGQYKDVFYLVRGLGRFWSWQIKLQSLCGFAGVRRGLARLESYWRKAGAVQEPPAAEPPATGVNSRVR